VPLVRISATTSIKVAKNRSRCFPVVAGYLAAYLLGTPIFKNKEQNFAEVLSFASFGAHIIVRVSTGGNAKQAT